MRIKIIAPGKLKEPYLRKAQEYYSSILSKGIDFEIIEVQDERNDISEAMVKKAEGERILKKIRPDQYIISLAIDGKPVTADELSRKLSRLTSRDNKEVVFVIGGSLGLSDEVLSRSDLRLSFSPMTFPHQLMRIMLLEMISSLHL